MSIQSNLEQKRPKINFQGTLKSILELIINHFLVQKIQEKRSEGKCEILKGLYQMAF